MNQKDTFTLGGKEFSSRFILGSGKFSLGSCESMCRKSRGCRLSRLPSVVQMKVDLQIFWIIFRKM